MTVAGAWVGFGHGLREGAAAGEQGCGEDQGLHGFLLGFAARSRAARKAKRG